MRYCADVIKRIYYKVLLTVTCILTRKLLPHKRAHKRDGWCVTHTLRDPNINGGGVHYCSDAELVTDLLKGLYDTDKAFYRIRSKGAHPEQPEL